MNADNSTPKPRMCPERPFAVLMVLAVPLAGYVAWPRIAWGWSAWFPITVLVVFAASMLFFACDLWRMGRQR